MIEMKPVTTVDETFDLRVARETLRTVDFLSAFVTLGAVGNTFQIGMPHGKRTR